MQGNGFLVVLSLVQFFVLDFRPCPVRQLGNELHPQVAVDELVDVHGQPLQLGLVAAVLPVQVHYVRVGALEQQVLDLLDEALLHEEVESGVAKAVDVVETGAPPNESAGYLVVFLQDLVHQNGHALLVLFVEVGSPH